MKLAVVGVGLIGGSIGLAARQRLGAVVAGFDPEPANLERALELEVIDSAAADVATAVKGAEVVFCAAPVGALPAAVTAALDATDEGAVVTDVGSTKRELVERLAASAAAERYIGGHPLAGAETAGVENARAELLEGARWYLTPTETSSGILYDSLQRLIAGLGARPQAIDPATHDRVMATVSHLPHVIANALVREARPRSADSAPSPSGCQRSVRAFAIRPAWREPTRRSGATSSSATARPWPRGSTR